MNKKTRILATKIWTELCIHCEHNEVVSGREAVCTCAPKIGTQYHRIGIDVCPIMHRIVEQLEDL